MARVSKAATCSNALATGGLHGGIGGIGDAGLQISERAP
jgi:hypothetical protein